MHLYHAENELPGIGILLDAKALADRLSGWLGAGELSIANIRYKPGTSCLVSYRHTTITGASWLHAKAFKNTDWPIRKKKLIDKADSKSRWIDNDLAFAVFKFPFDSRLPGLSEFAADHDSFLSKVFFDEKLEGQNLESFEILAYKPNRRFVTKLIFESAEPLVLKLHDKDSFKNVLSSAGALKKLAVSNVPKRFGRSARHQALAYQWLKGESVDLAIQSPESRRESLQKTFDYLDRLHRPVDSRKIKLPVRRLSEGIESTASYLDQVCSPVGVLAKAIGEQLSMKLPTSMNPVLVHGDFHDRQLIEDKNQVRACDLDECCIGDRTTDLANLVAHLRYRACLNNTFVAAAEEVNSQVLQHLSRTADNETRERYLWNCSASLFRLATHPFRSGDEAWIQKTENVLSTVEIQLKQSTLSRPATAGVESDNPAFAVKNDPAFSFLHKAFDTKIATKIFKKFLPKLKQRLGSFAIHRVVARRCKPGRRCLIEYELATDNGLVSILGKATAKRLDRKAYKTQQTLFRKHQFGRQNVDGLCVPRTIGTIEFWQMWFQENVKGLTAADLMRDQKLSGKTEQIVASLNKLHQSDFQPSQEHSVADELEILSVRLHSMMKQQPEAEKLIAEILENCVAVGNSIAEHPMVPIHRDFYQDQILFCDDETYLLDLDLVALGHPALDIGNFLAHLTEHGIRIHDDADFWREENNEIVKHFLEHNPDCTRFDVKAFKAISLARHISISWEMEDRRFAFQKILACAQTHLRKLTDSQLVTQR